MKGLWVIWGLTIFFGVLHVLTGGQDFVEFCAAGLVINAITIATSIIVKEIKNARKD